mgnify:CR=1 FL=1
MSFKRQPIRHPIAQADSTCRTPAVVFRRIAKSPPQPAMIKAVIQNPLASRLWVAKNGTRATCSLPPSSRSTNTASPLLVIIGTWLKVKGPGSIAPE